MIMLGNDPSFKVCVHCCWINTLFWEKKNTSEETCLQTDKYVNSYDQGLCSTGDGKGKMARIRQDGVGKWMVSSAEWWMILIWCEWNKRFLVKFLFF